MSARLTSDRHLLGAVLVCGAALSFESLSGLHALTYVAGAVGLVAIHERLRTEFSPAIALLTSTLIFAGTSLFWSMTRATSIVDTAVFAFVAVLALSLSYWPSIRVRRLVWCLMAALPIVASYAVDGSGAPSSQAATALEALFSSSIGLLSLTPVAYVAVLGTLFYFRQNAAWAAATLTVFVIWVVARGLIQSPNHAEPFGHGLTGVLALTAPGLAFVLAWARTKPLAALAPLAVAAVVWNYWLMVQYTAGTLPKDQPVSFAAMVRQQADVHTRPSYWYPFAFPANALFAWRQNVPIDRYELLSAHPPRDAFELVMDRGADRFLLDGWGAAATTSSGPVRWTTKGRATLLFPLLPPTSAVVVQLVFNARVEEPPVAVELAVEINDEEVGRLSAAPTPGEAQLTIPAAVVSRALRAGYNRLAFVNHGIHRVDPSDARPAGPLAARSAAAPFPVAIHRIRIAPVS